ncbi:major facilitator superfamily domain-containing protein [Roridomyces roridus]|uniref:Major facilitator superfamily domain-containing protein n=1 Tax=Roridomyces roridus TaxID=1738132 RepID=A0AAD7BRT6_9AGAR|nr:major facilitator superfamily domain-containing protein [Roridomyces roridus]
MDHIYTYSLTYLAPHDPHSSPRPTLMSDHTSATADHQHHSFDPDEQKFKYDLELSLPRPDPPREAKEGDLVGCLTILGTFFIQFCTLGSSNAFGVYQDYYTRNSLSNMTPSDISWIGSLQLCLQYAPGILVGRAFDAGYFHQMLALGSVLQVASIFMISLAQPHQYYQVFLAQGVASGIGQSLLFLPSLSIIGQHFKRHRALATGVGVSGASFGGVIWPILLNQLVNQRGTSFQNAVRGTGALSGLLLIVANLVMRTRSAPRSEPGPGPAKPELGVILSDASFMISVLGAFVVGLGLFFPYFYLQLYAINRGIDEGLAFYVVRERSLPFSPSTHSQQLAILNAGSVLGRILPNLLADRVGPYNTIIPCLFISAGLIFSIFGLKSVAGIVVFGVLYGFWSGSYVSLIPTLIVQFASHSGEHGTRMGVAFSLVSISMLIGTPISGALLHSVEGQYIWFRPIVFCGIMLASGAVIFSCSRYLFVREGRGETRGQLV